MIEIQKAAATSCGLTCASVRKRGGEHNKKSSDPFFGGKKGVRLS